MQGFEGGVPYISIAVIKPCPKATWEERGLFGLCILSYSPLKEAKAELKAGYHGRMLFPGLFSLLSETPQDHLPPINY